ILLLTYGDDLALTWGRRVRGLIEEFGPEFGVQLRQDSRRADSFETTAGGSFFAGGARTAVLGRPADLVVYDDPAKPEEATSDVVSESVWENYVTTIRSRLSEEGAIVAVGTRFGLRDFFGRLKDAERGGSESWRWLILPAIGEDNDPLGRAPGEPLAPEIKSLAFLEETRRSVGPWVWQTAWMQDPRPRSGGVFPVDRLIRVNSAPGGAGRIRAWDLSAGVVGGDWTVGLRLAQWLRVVYVEDVVRFRLAPGERDERIRAVADADGRRVGIIFEQEGGSAGIAQCDSLRRLLHDRSVHVEKPLGNKELRAGPVASACHVGRVAIVDGQPWAPTFLAELAAFPGGRFDDCVDGLSLGYNFFSARPGWGRAREGS
ncbi:MAG: hypothetical protein L0227_12840, partial [Chloroflexi bacterium]|nr:hypothetical protein [Chloroflexota bacterium]